MSKKEKTIEDLLIEAEVLNEEEPYKVPDNWIWVKLKNISKVISKGTTPPKSKGHDYTEEGINFLRVENITKNQTLDTDNVKFIREITHTSVLKRSMGEEGDVLISIAGALGRVAIIRFEHLPCNMNQAIAFIRLFNEQVIPDYIKFAISSTDIKKNLLKEQKVTAQPNLSLENIGDLLIPLAPLNEQSRIVEKVEHLLGKFDEAKLLIDEASKTFELRRAAILDKAFRGEGLNSDVIQIDKENQPYMLPEAWEWKRFDEVARVCSMLVDPKHYPKLPHIAPDNIEKKTGRLLEYMTVEESNVKSSKHHFYKGQILYSKIRPYLSKVTLIEFDGLCSADMYPIETQLNIKYLYWYMLSPLFVERASTAGSRSVLPKINQKELGQIPVPVPPAETQEKIVTLIEGLLSQEESTISYINHAIKSIEIMKQSILSKAFKGDLGTNDPTDESAIELLKEVLQVQLD